MRTNNHNPKWEKVEEFKLWLTKNLESESSYCNLCKCDLSSRRDLISRHSQHCDVHKKKLAIKIKSIQSLGLLDDIIVNPELVEQNSSLKVTEYHPSWNIGRPWLRYEEKTPHTAYCHSCQGPLYASMYSITRHEGSDKHKLKSISLDTNELDSFNYQQAMAKIQMCVFIVNQGLAFILIDSLVPYFKIMFYDSAILADFNQNRKQLVPILKSVIVPTHKERLGHILKINFFSLLVDESTDVSIKQCMCIVVRYFCPETNSVRESLWDLVSIFDGDEKTKADAETLSEKIFDTFRNYDIPLTNILGFSSDTASVMIGVNSSVAQKLSKHNPCVTIVKCSCHIQHLCASDAVKTLPPIYQNINNLFYNYLGPSSKRCHRWRILQIKSKLKPLRLLKPIFTRWLSIYPCMKRILGRWSSLRRFFAAEVKRTKGDATAKKLLAYLRNPTNKLYHSYLVTMYMKLYLVMKTLQYEKPLLSEQHTITRNLYLGLLKMYMKQEYVENTNITLINPKDESNKKKLNNISLHHEVKKLLRKEKPQVQEKFLKDAAKFLEELCQKFKERYNFKGDYSTYLECLSPLNILKTNTDENGEKFLKELIVELPMLTNNYEENCVQTIEKEFVELKTSGFTASDFNDLRPDIFWASVKNYVNEAGHCPFVNVASFALNVLCLPNSNAATERVWSQYHWQKNLKRNCLNHESIRAILIAKQYIADTGGILNFLVTNDMLLKMANSSLDNTKDYLDIGIPDSYDDEEISQSYIKECEQDDLTVNSLQEPQNETNENDDDIIMKNMSLTGSQCITESLVHLSFGSTCQVEDDVMDTVEDNVMDTIEDDGMDTVEGGTVDGIGSKKFLNNGLFTDYRYYFTQLPYLDEEGKILQKSHSVGKYIMELDATKMLEINLFSSAYQTLMLPGLWLDGDIINACGAILQKKWENVTFLSTYDTAFLFHDYWMTNVAEPNSFLFTRDFPETGIIFMPYLLDDHWRLFCVFLDSNSIFLLDPIDKCRDILIIEEKRAMTAFIKYTMVCKRRNIQNSFTKPNSWQLKSYNIERPYQTDGYSCGDFVIYYMEVIGQKGDFDLHFSPDNYRQETAKLLIESSLNISQDCMFCSYIPSEEEIKNKAERKKVKITCNNCNRYAHEKCLGNFTWNNFCPICTAYLHRWGDL